VEPSPDTGVRPLVLILGPLERTKLLTGHLNACDYRAAGAKDASQALRAIENAAPPVRVVLLATDHGLDDPATTIREIGAGAPQSLQWIAIGRRPDDETIDELRDAGVRFGLFGALTEEELRFVVNEAHFVASGELQRLELRVPTMLRVTVSTKTGDRLAVLCNLSTTGAYLATPRPALRGGTVQLQIPLDEGDVDVQGLVIWNNVPGNLRRANVPVGMGVRFTDVSPEATEMLEKYILERADSYRL
jgi:hypothetical protein